ncbi:MAG: thioredoxin family protein [Bacteroidia bacterium]|nr:thioredoxin family protein [Bacteroidia bacterium]
MRKALILLLFIGISVIASAQNWETNIEKAKTRAAQENKNIILVFSGSDWCIPCMRLEKNIWESADFISYSKEHFVMLRADFPKKKANALSKDQQAHNDKLAETYNKDGLFPYVVILDKNGKIKGSTGYKNNTPAEYIALLHSIEKN